MSRKEVHRPGLVKAACARRITTRQLAEALRMSLRQARRLKRRFEAGGAAGLTHRSRGRPSQRRLATTTRDEVIRLMTTVYDGFNDTHMTEKLREQHGLPISRESVRRRRQHLGLAPQRARQAPQARRRRTPEAARGALVQIDGSPFAWLEQRGPELMLLGAIDDATGEILALQFRSAEDVHGYTTLFHDVFTTHGLPLAFYGDGLNLLVRNDDHWSLDEELAGRQAPTHLGTMLQALGIGYLRARSPQAKGRIERLWGTLQDRLVSELRLRGIATVEAAQAYLPQFIADFNRRFGRPPADPAPVWRRPPRHLALILGCRYRRVVAHDNTVRLGPAVQQAPCDAAPARVDGRVSGRYCSAWRALAAVGGASHVVSAPRAVLADAAGRPRRRRLRGRRRCPRFRLRDPVARVGGPIRGERDDGDR